MRSSSRRKARSNSSPRWPPRAGARRTRPSTAPLMSSRSGSSTAASASHSKSSSRSSSPSLRLTVRQAASTAERDWDSPSVGSSPDCSGVRSDCVVLDLGLPGLSGWRVIEELQANKALGETPLLVYTARDLTRKEEVRLGTAAKSIVMKDARSPERLKQEIMAILQGAETDVEPALESGSNGAEAMSAALAGKKVLVVDDDIRNIFALTALLERQRMDVVSVDSGQEALDLLTGNSDIDIALVDVMMPEMDGYVTMSKMRELRAFADRPIIALTAKAMKGDREKCIEAGASDYIAKPINNVHLLSMLKSWLVQ